MKVISLALLLLGLVFASAFTETEYQRSFSNWAQEHGKAYSTDEFQARYTIFKSNLDYITEWNAQNSETVLGLNVLADLTNEEYQRFYLGTKIDGSARLEAAKANPTLEVFDNYNTTVDWRTKGVVTPIKDQGQCGSCWSFSTTGSVEGAHALATKNLVSLSEQNLVDCSTAQGNSGCNGGLMDYAFKYIIANKGIDTESTYPYTAKDGTCNFNAANVGATISTYQDVAAGDEKALAAAALKQPVSVAIDASHMSFQFYKTGVYWSLLCSTTKLDHGVLVVGYGTDTASNRNYWVVKNSWGTGWGQDGYIFMSKDRSNNCGIATSASYPIV